MCARVVSAKQYIVASSSVRRIHHASREKKVVQTAVRSASIHVSMKLKLFSLDYDMVKKLIKWGILSCKSIWTMLALKKGKSVLCGVIKLICVVNDY
jgi:hypothetical protein